MRIVRDVTFNTQSTMDVVSGSLYSVSTAIAIQIQNLTSNLKTSMLCHIHHLSNEHLASYPSFSNLAPDVISVDFEAKILRHIRQPLIQYLRTRQPLIQYLRTKWSQSYNRYFPFYSKQPVHVAYSEKAFG